MSYDTSPERRDLPLTEEEVDGISQAAAGSLAGSPAAIRHLLARMRATLAQQRQQRQHLREQLSQLQTQGNSGERLLKEMADLSEEQRQQILGAHLAAKEAELDEIRQELEMEAVAARSLRARLRRRAELLGTAASEETRMALSELLRVEGLGDGDDEALGGA